MATILFIDDDATVLRALVRMLRADRQRWQMTFALGGESGLAVLRSRIFDVLVTDLRMLGVDGIAMLAAARRFAPKTIRIMLSGSLVDAAQIDAHYLLEKPCDRETLRGALRCAIIHSATLKQIA